VYDLIANFKGDGYLVFFGLLDLMSKDFDINNPGTNTFSIKYVTKNLQVSRRFLTKVLDFIGKHPKEKGKIFYTIEGTNITVKCKRLKNLCDTWTQKQLRLNFDATST